MTGQQQAANHRQECSLPPEAEDGQEGGPETEAGEEMGGFPKLVNIILSKPRR